MGRQGTSRGDVSRRLGAYTRAHRQRRRWLAGLVVAAAAVVLCTVCALTVPASTLTWDQVDGGEEQAETTEEAAVQTASATEDETSAEVATTLPDGASVPEGYTQTFTYEDADKCYAVSAYAAEGVVPEGATLKASLLSESDDAYTAAEEALAADADDESDYGFAALDIRFEDAEGNEVEPSGDVYVVINAEGLLPDNADPSTVIVQHLAEDESGAVASVDAVADVADATDGVVNVSDDTNVQAAFSVDSFSTFTITWSNYFRVTVHYVDESGNEIQGAQTQAVSISNGQTVAFFNYVGDISGYTYSGAHYNSYNGNTVTSMSASSSSRPGNTRTLTFYNGNNVVDTLTASSRTQNADVYLVYTKDSTGGTITQKATVTTSKTAVLKDDDSGNYDLTLSITGTQGSESNPVAMDVLFIVDRSASMTNNKSQRLANAKTAMNTLVSSLESNSNIDARYSIVTFSGPTKTGNSNGKEDASVHMNWTVVSGNNVSNSIDSITASGGTNYQAGLDVGTDQLNSARSGAIKVVIFLSDGEPTWSYNYGYGTGALNRNGSGWNETLDQAKKMSCDYFYAVGIGSSSSSYLQDLVGTNGVSATTKQYIKAKDDGSNLADLFKGISSSVTFFAASNVTISDPLSEYADLVLVNDSPQFTITVTRAAYTDSDGMQHGEQTWTTAQPVGNNGTLAFKDAENNDVTVTASYNSTTKTITLDFPDEYELEEGYTYSISTVITPSEAAISAGMNSDAAKQTPDKGTGTHADKSETGFWSNDNANAKVTYTANDEEGSTLFPKPVIQVPEAKTGDLIITKEVDGATLKDSKDYIFTISTTVDMSSASPMIGETSVNFNKIDEYTWTASVTVSAKSVANNVDGSITITGLPLGTYTVTEITDDTSSNDVGISGYRFDGVSYQVGSNTETSIAPTVTLSSDATTPIVNVKNKYTQVADITVTKVDAQDNSKKLSGAKFYLTKTVENVTYYYKYDTDTYTVNWANSQDDATLFTSSAVEETLGTFTIYGLEDGSYSLVETKAPDGYQLPSSGFNFTLSNGEVHYESVSGGQAITVTNTTGTVLPATGGSGTTWFTFGGVALIAAAACGYGFKRSHERRNARS